MIPINATKKQIASWAREQLSRSGLSVACLEADDAAIGAIIFALSGVGEHDAAADIALRATIAA